MPWTDITRTEQRRDFERCPTDLTDNEWSVLSPFVPPARPGGRPRTTDMRKIMNAILSWPVAGWLGGMLSKDSPLVSTVRGYFYAWRGDGTLAPMNYALVQAARELVHACAAKNCKGC